jgi:hypothetical protein
MQRQSSKPKGNGGAVANSNLGDRPEGLKASNNVFPDGGVKEMRNSEVTSRRPAIPPKEPISPEAEGEACSLARNLARRAEFWAGMESTPRPPNFFGTQMSAHATLH